MATMADTLENKGETTTERLLICSYGEGGVPEKLGNIDKNKI